MVLEMKIPSPGESITEVEISQWLVKDGDVVTKDQTIAEIDSDKATLDLPAEASGKITLKAEEGDLMAVGDIVCLIDTTVASDSKPLIKEPVIEVAKEDKKVDLVEDDGISITPLARNIASDKGIDINEIKAKGDKITKDDVLKIVPAMGSSNDEGRSENREKLSMLRRKVAERLVSVKNETAMLTTFNEADLSNIFELRKKYKEAFSQKHGVGLGFMSFFTKAVTRALELYPDVNSMIDGNEKISFNYCDISIAVSGPKGLMTPILRNSQNLSFAAVEQEIKRLADHVRNKTITVDDLTGGTFTISNGGVFGSMLSTPIINPPQSGILGMHNIIQRPVAIDGKVEIRPMMYLALSYDHRIIDGNQSVGFLIAVKEGVEDPENILMDGKVEKHLGLN
ncbi:MAG: 2-oxoglutarate dehydrogenase complex dihydrolipoyllysine-residue succinyltransferase [Cryomorphaceae bacterium]|jgi:2-oxoglutarate dehydrogenase E2 component (dihydrolipoamide succinyltransferase)|nr:2-oxoglutarate dehydrogenase complex dihydrolipoyllysine-residue succinyltransferase [Cryomorphaceae bacterium]MBT3503461.1 2-oxoglutarate dehydrogenase complex dihydrolipoyllysine-residue succinyltransferase [Cryomorphaceae bacterium]MBT3688993.1 2-oxoglutarate dehydrogenase complex dihydrolipoyllysine-residue succinyltransferase [Cryomorphaceae bacterium]MBT4222354.1 2-oxoglutarate dehydrogenase complex dihydrolipoyllysine-residue succinyltransferase [Cryomorphaceae bacterium]MBT4517760.1 